VQGGEHPGKGLRVCFIGSVGLNLNSHVAASPPGPRTSQREADNEQDDGEECLQGKLPQSIWDHRDPPPGQSRQGMNESVWSDALPLDVPSPA
jgi:hypothetical protein